MTIDLEKPIRDWALDILPYDRSDHAVVSELNARDARELLITYHNWMSRHIPPVPRRVLRSKAFDANPVAAARKADLDALLEKIRVGGDLKPHLSTRTDIVIEPSTKKMPRRRDLDFMLLDWEVHHLHISQKMRADGYVERDDPLLFVVFRRDTAYVLDLMTHHDFSRDHILKILADEWPGAELVIELKAGPGQKIIGLAHDYTEEERDRLRRNGINVLVQVDGRVYKPAGGMTTAGTSIKASMAADAVMRRVDDLKEALENDKPQFDRYAAQYGLTWPDNPTFEFGILPPVGLGFKELSTNLAMAVA